MVYARAVAEQNDQSSRRAQRRAKGTQDSPVDSEPISEAPENAEPQESTAERIRDRNARIREKAAADRRARREQAAANAAIPVGLDTAERIDDIFVRTTHAATQWVTQNFRWLQWVVILAVLGGLGWQGYTYMTRLRQARSTDALMSGLDAELGTLKSDELEDSKEIRAIDPRPSFKDDAQRLASAERGYRAAWAAHSESGSGWLARLGLAGILLDQQKWSEALGHYRAVRQSQLAKDSVEIAGRALEGMGMALEGQGDAEGALQAYRELTNQEGAGNLSVLGLYHQARILLGQGNKDKAKQLVQKAQERLTKEGQQPGWAYLGAQVRELMGRIDPTLAKPSADMTQTLEQLLRNDPKRLEELLSSMPAVPAQSGSGSPAPVETPAEEP